MLSSSSRHDLEGAALTEPIRVRVHASDHLSEAGVAAELKQRPEVRVVSGSDEADVAIVVADDVDEDAVRMIRAAQRGDGTLPSDLLGRLLTQVGKLQRQVLVPRGLSFSGLSKREIAVLRLVAEGLDTGEIAQRLAYSERTIKNVIHDVTTRLQLRNRSQAVAYAVREGLI